MIKTFTLLAAGLGCAHLAGAQSLNVYKPAGHVAVEKGSKTMSAPFCGGFNTPQFTMGDLNNDGKEDLITFEGFGKTGVRTFINHGMAGQPDYRYAPQYEAAFPEIVNYMMLRDYNRDGIPDLFHAGLGGYNVSRGYYANGMLRFQFYKELSYPTPGGDANAYVGNSDIPGIADVDGDGDLDFFSFSINGVRVLLYKNLQEEYGLPRDSIRLGVASGCWGGTLQPVVRTHILGTPQNHCDTNYIAPPQTPDPAGGAGLPSSLAKTTMHGANTLCMIDIDGDGDLDYLNGNGAFEDIQLLINGRVEYNNGRDTIVAQDTLWQQNGIRYVGSNFPAAFHIDYNGDGKKDIVIAPHGAGSRNRNQVWYYQNNGTAAAPRFDFVTDSLMSNDIIDAGRNSRPLFYDFNKDGKPDQLIGALEKLPDGREVSRLHYYENITPGEEALRSNNQLQAQAGAAAPRFRFITEDLVGISGMNVYATDPAVGDVDGDGKDDLLIGRADGKVLFFRNTAASANVAPVWVLAEGRMTRNGSDLLDVWANASPAFYDINKDGKPDLVLGQDDGTLTAYLNTNTASGVVSFGAPIDTFGGVRVPDWDPAPRPFRSSRPFFGKIQAGSNQDYLLMGGYYGRLYVWDHVETGDVNAPFRLIADTFSNLNLQPYTAPAVADVDGDGLLEMVVGSETGGLLLYWTGTGLGVNNTVSASGRMALYPNPAVDAFTLDCSGAGNPSGVVVTVLDLTGRIVFREKWPVGKAIGQIETQGWQAGTYLVSVAGSSGIETQKIQILR